MSANSSSSLASLKGLGLKSQAQLASIGIHSVSTFLQTDPFEMYAALKKKDASTSLNMLYAMIGAQENVHWQHIARERKMQILLRLDDMGIAP